MRGRKKRELRLSERILQFRGSAREAIDRKLAQIDDENLYNEVETRLSAVLAHLMRAMDEAVAAEAAMDKQSEWLLQLIEKAQQERAGGAKCRTNSAFPIPRRPQRRYLPSFRR